MIHCCWVDWWWWWHHRHVEMTKVIKVAIYPNDFRALAFYFSPTAKEQSHWYWILPVPARDLLAAFSEMIKTSCHLVTKTTNLKRLSMLVQAKAENISLKASPKASAMTGYRKRWRLEGQGICQPFFRKVCSVAFRISHTIITQSDLLQGSPNWTSNLPSFFMPFQPIIHTAILMIFLKQRTDWFSLLKILFDFPLAATYMPTPYYGAHSLSWFGTYLPSISCLYILFVLTWF